MIDPLPIIKAWLDENAEVLENEGIFRDDLSRVGLRKWLSEHPELVHPDQIKLAIDCLRAAGIGRDDLTTPVQCRATY